MSQLDDQTAQIKERQEIAEADRWNLELMYPDNEAWELDYRSATDAAGDYRRFAGHLLDSPATLQEALTERDRIWQLVERVYVYARMRKDEDTRVALYQEMADRSQSLLAETAAKLAFLSPELLAAPAETIRSFIDQDAGLEIYRHSLEELLRKKPHILSEAEEAILAKTGQLLRATNDIFSMINNADMRFRPIRDENGCEIEVTHGRYIGLMESADREIRRQAFESMYASYEAQKNTIAATYNFNTKTDTVLAEIRRYPSALVAGLDDDAIPPAVYDNLIKAVHEALPDLHRYVRLRRKALKLDQVHMYDMYASLSDAEIEHIPYARALDMVAEGLRPLGEEYAAIMREAFTSRWIDVYENRGKTSGAYSFGSYDSPPYILLNYSGKLKDVFTIAHEMGHSVNSWLTRRAQPFVYGGHSIFTAEVASTVNENLLARDLLSRETDPARKLYLLNLFIDEFRATLFRQTMFAEFERWSHQVVEEGGVLTAELMSDYYLELNRLYFGPEVYYDEPIAMEWARIPHFYNAFYVYKYATGFSAAVALADGVLNGGQEKLAAYLDFLKAGESAQPLILLQRAGVDMSRPEPVTRALSVFSGLIDELESLL
jgi:oligoendopeptidase F